LRAFRDACPATRVVWVTARRPSIFANRLAELADGLIDEIHQRSGVGERWLAPLPEYLRGRFDVVLCTETRLRDTLALRRVRCGRFIAPAANFLFSSVASPKAFSDGSAYERFTELLALAAGRPLQPQARLELPPHLERAADEALGGAARYVGLCPGAGGKRKIWPLENFLALAQRLREQGLMPAFFLGPEETELREAIGARLPEAMFVEDLPAVRSHDSPLRTVALARRMIFSVCNDSGGGHLIAAAGRPTVTLFGHTSPGKFASPYCRQIAISAREFGADDVSAIGVADVLERVTASGLL